MCRTGGKVNLDDIRWGPSDWDALNKARRQQHFLQVNITAEDIAICEAKALEMGHLRNSIRQGEGNLAGFLGELAVHRWLVGSTWENTYHYDVIEAGGRAVDAKTKCCTTRPELDFECSVPAASTFQECDDYVFVRCLNDLSRLWIVGRCTKEWFMANAKLWRVGKVDPANGWVTKADCYNCSIRNVRRSTEA